MGHKCFTQVGPVLVQTTLSNLFCFLNIIQLVKAPYNIILYDYVLHFS